MTQYVYVIGPVGGPYKIGYASDIKTRLVSLQIGNHELLIVHFKMATKSALTVEALTHNDLILNHIRGEWFDCELSPAIATIKRHAIEVKIDSTIERVMGLHPLANA